MSSNLKQKLVFTGLFTTSVIAAAIAYQFGGAARTYLDASPDALAAERPVTKNFEEVLETLKKGKRVEIRRKVGGKTQVKIVEGSLPISDDEYRYLHRVMLRRAKVRRQDYDAYITKLVTKDNVTLADMEREAMMSFGALRAEYELKLFEKGDYLILDDKVVKPPIPKGWNWTRFNSMYRINGQTRAMVTMYDPKKAPRLENEYRRYTNLADSRLDDWARNFNKKTVTERRKIIARQREINERIRILSVKDKNLPDVGAEWVRLWKQRSPDGIRFDDVSAYAMLQQ